MTRSILLINPNTSRATTRMMLRLARRDLPPGVGLRAATARHGVPMIVNEDELRTAEAEVLARGLAGAAHTQAIIVAAFGNPGAEALRARLPIPVIGIGEAAIRVAAADGRRFGIATTTPELRESIAGCVRSLGLQSQFTGLRIPDGDPRALAAQSSLQEAQLALATSACIGDGAQAVVIGGGPLAESAVRLARRFAVPVISPVSAAMQLACQAMG